MMGGTAPSPGEPMGATVAVGRVTTVLEGRWFQVQTGAGQVRAERALSCLVLPRPGARVVCVETGSGSGHILAVLERPDGAPLEIALARETHISSGRHPLRLSGGSHLELSSDDALHLRAQDTVLHSRRLHVIGEELRTLFRRAWTSLTEVSLMGRVLSIVTDHLRLRAKTSEREVETVERARCDHLDLEARRTFQIRGEQVLAGGRKLVRIDGDQIHLG